MLNISRDIDLKNSKIESILNKMFHPDWLRATAVKMGFIQRNRKIDPAVFFWVLVLGFGVGMKRTIASLRRSYETVSAETLVPSSFHARFNKGLIAYLKECLSHGIEELCQYTSIRLSNKLADFKDIIVSDGTVIALHEKLASLFPGTRRKAELKIHLVSGITGNTKSVAVYPGKTADVKTMRIGTWVENNILLFDLGYYKHEVFSKIIHYKGYFVSRLKDNSNPTIVSVIQENEVCSENIEVKKFKEILPKLKGKVVDLQVMISFKGQKITGKESAQEEDYKIYRRKEGADKNTIALRLVGVFNDESKEYHFYLTNINPNQLTAEEIALLYRVR